MTVICIGPVCIPLHTLLPGILFVIYQLWSRLKGYFTPQDASKTSGTKAISDDGTQQRRSKTSKAGGRSAKIRQRRGGAGGGVKDIESLDEWNALLSETKNGGVLIADFWNDGCGPCKSIAPYYEELSNTHKHIDFVKVNCDNLHSLAVDQGVMALPTFIAFRDGNRIDRLTGADQRKLTAFVEKHI